MDMPTQLHLATQYLATTGICFLDKKEDDSHTNLGFSISGKSLETWPLDDSGTKLCLDYSSFMLRWVSEDTQTFPLHGKSHNEVIHWIKEVSHSLSTAKSYAYELHYDLPYCMDMNEKFQLNDAGKIEELIQIRTLANTVLAKVLDKHNLSSEIRIWPHHFDTGAFSPLGNGSETAIGLGLTIPDSLVDDYYFYISGYHGHTGLDTAQFTPLTKGKWLNEGFKGAVLPISNVTEEEVVIFFNEAIQAYKS